MRVTVHQETSELASSAQVSQRTPDTRATGLCTAGCSTPLVLGQLFTLLRLFLQEFGLPSSHTLNSCVMTFYIIYFLLVQRFRFVTSCFSHQCRLLHHICAVFA